MEITKKSRISSKNCNKLSRVLVSRVVWLFLFMIACHVNVWRIIDLLKVYWNVHDVKCEASDASEIFFQEIINMTKPACIVVDVSQNLWQANENLETSWIEYQGCRLRWFLWKNFNTLFFLRKHVNAWAWQLHWRSSRFCGKYNEMFLRKIAENDVFYNIWTDLILIIPAIWCLTWACWF